MLFRHSTPCPPIADGRDAWCQAGATHHMGAARGRWTSQLVALADMLGIEAVVI